MGLHCSYASLELQKFKSYAMCIYTRLLLDNRSKFSLIYIYIYSRGFDCSPRDIDQMAARYQTGEVC
jgi:hypothetical protein